MGKAFSAHFKLRDRVDLCLNEDAGAEVAAEGVDDSTDEDDGVDDGMGCGSVSVGGISGVEVGCCSVWALLFAAFVVAFDESFFLRR